MVLNSNKFAAFQDSWITVQISKFLLPLPLDSRSALGSMCCSQQIEMHLSNCFLTQKKDNGRVINLLSPSNQPAHSLHSLQVNTYVHD